MKKMRKFIRRNKIVRFSFRARVNHAWSKKDCLMYNRHLAGVMKKQKSPRCPNNSISWIPAFTFTIKKCEVWFCQEPHHKPPTKQSFQPMLLKGRMYQHWYWHLRSFFCCWRKGITSSHSNQITSRSHRRYIFDGLMCAMLKLCALRL